mmetsp:Transcript_27925/g.68116  ORF Transcript_27925/g.68116 Transcript_27925/m.68116 type:complete len:179 (-) Transcript_27925:2373-2909(-)
MRELKFEEGRLFLSKLIKFQGQKILNFLKANLGFFKVFRLQKKRIFFCSFSLYVRATNFSKKKTGSLGICIGRFTKIKKFKFLISFVNLLLKNKNLLSVIINEHGEKVFLQGEHLSKENLIKISKKFSKNNCFLILNKKNIPLGFGESIKNSLFIEKTKKKDILIINQGDTGLYIRNI